MGELYCVCKEASATVCDSCTKGNSINPDRCFANDSWDRELSPTILHYSHAQIKMTLEKLDGI